MERSVVMRLVKQLIAGRVGIDKKRVTTRASLEELGADELAVVEICMSIEEACGVEVTDAEAAGLRTVDDVVRLFQESATYAEREGLRTMADVERVVEECAAREMFGRAPGAGPADAPTDDPWRTELDAHLAAVGNVVDEALAEWIAAEESEALDAAAGRLSAARTVRELDLRVASVEAWYQGRFNGAVTSVCDGMGFPARQWLMRDAERNWLSERLRPERARVEGALRDFKSAATAFADYARETSGFAGFLKGAVGGYLDPVDGISALWGESRAQREGKRTEGLLRDAATALGEASATFSQELDAAVVTHWNSFIPGLAEVVAEEIERQRAPQPEQARAPLPRGHAIPAPQQGSGFGKALVLVVATVGLVAAGVGGWRWYERRSHGAQGTATWQPPVAAAASVTARTTLQAGAVVRQGPGDTFGALVTMASATTGTIVDSSVPGWLKVSTDVGVVGWVRTVDTGASAAQ